MVLTFCGCGLTFFICSCILVRWQVIDSISFIMRLV